MFFEKCRQRLRKGDRFEKSDGAKETFDLWYGEARKFAQAEVRDEKRMLKLYKKSDDEDVPSGYEDLMKRCLEYIASRRPLIDVVRVDLQGLMEIAAEIDRDHHNSTTITVHNGVETKKEEESDDKTSGVHIEMGTISSTEISSGDKTDEPEILLEI